MDVHYKDVGQSFHPKYLRQNIEKEILPASCVRLLTKPLKNELKFG